MKAAMRESLLTAEILLVSAIGAGIIVITLHACGVSKYHGLCRPCHNKGIETPVRYMLLPDKWECKECRKECPTCKEKREQ
jgi:hypothetical protein